MSLQELAQAFKATSERANREPLKHMRWLPGQQAFLSDPSPRKLFRAGNQAMGKTTCGLADVVFRCLGEHPFLDVPTPPIEAWVLCASWSQSLAVQTKLWDMLPKHRVHADTEFCPVRGFRGVMPAVRFDNDSIIRIKTTGQGGLALSGSTIHCALFDEPPASARVFSEVQKRVMHAGSQGVVMLCLTPVNAPTDWLKAACASGLIKDIHYRLEPQNMIPVGHTEPLRLKDGTVCDQKWIDQILSETMAHERNVVCHGEWEMRATGRVFTDFRDIEHVTAESPRCQVDLALGVDWGDGKSFSQTAILCAVDSSGPFEKVWVLDEYVSEGSTLIEDDARAIQAMLARQGVEWGDLDFVYGDRDYSGRRRGATRKSNRDLTDAVSKLLGIPSGRLRPAVKTAKTGHGTGTGSVHRGVRFIHYAMVRAGHFHISHRCKRLIACLKRWELRRDDEYKHSIDALRYSLSHWIFKRRTSDGTVVRIGA